MPSLDPAPSSQHPIPAPVPAPVPDPIEVEDEQQEKPFHQGALERLRRTGRLFGPDDEDNPKEEMEEDAEYAEDAEWDNEPVGLYFPIEKTHILFSSFSDFLTVAIHNILFYRNIYPPATFLSTKAFNLPVHQNRHPKVCAWVKDAVEAVLAQLSTGHVSRVAVVIHSPLDKPITIPQPNIPPTTATGDSQKPKSSVATRPLQQQQDELTIPQGSVLERWLFDTSHFPAWPAAKSTAAHTSHAMEEFGYAMERVSKEEHVRDAILDEYPERDEDEGDKNEEKKGESEHEGENGDGKGEDSEGDDEGKGNKPEYPKEPIEWTKIHWPDLDEQLRGALRRMASTAEKMPPLPEGCTFTVAIEMDQEGRAPIGV